MRNDKPNIIVQKTFEFAVQIIDFTEMLESKRKYNMASQLFKSGTSVGANVREAQNAESKADFIHKMKIAAKEADETKFWLEVCEASKHYPTVGNHLNEITEIEKIISKIIATSKRK